VEAFIKLMEEDVGQQRRDYSALRCSLAGSFSATS
jgi:hypothetical protein